MNVAAFFKMLLYPLLFITTTITKMIWKNYPDDNPVEEVAEMIIKQETGEEVDLTPDSPE